MSDEKKYVGKGWRRDFPNEGHVLNLSIKVADLPEPNQYGEVKLVVGERRKPDEKSHASHWVAIDTYVPGEKKAKPEETDLPF